jgi:hypothetical protein
MRLVRVDSKALFERIGPILVVGVSIATLPSFAQGNTFAYAIFGVAFLLAFFPAALLARRSSNGSGSGSGRLTEFGLGGIVGSVLILSTVEIPSLQTGVLGLLVGVILAAALFYRRSNKSLG